MRSFGIKGCRLRIAWGIILSALCQVPSGAVSWNPAKTDSISTPDSIGVAVPDTTVAQASFYVRHTERVKRRWAKLVPNQSTVQFAGNIGAWSLGLGWHYGKRDRWETEILFGYVPQSNGSEHHYTLTAKERYAPWRISLSRHERWAFEPFTTGLFVNFIFGEGFWRHAPSKYTKGYYGFTPKVRYNIYVGQRWHYNIPMRRRHFVKGISFYYELSTCDLYIVSAIPNKKITLGDILSLSIGLRLYAF